MTVAEAIVTKLKATSAVTSLCGQRIYNFEFPQTMTLWPAIRVQRISEVQPMHLRGGIAVYTSRVQMDSAFKKASGISHYAKAREVDEAARGAGDGTGLVGFKGTVGGMDILGIFPDSVRELYDAEELTIFRIVRDLIVTHTG